MSSELCPGPGWYAAGFRVRYCETDAAGIVNHASYLAWFEEGRSELSRRLGMPYSDLEREGIDLVVTRVEARYRQAARYDDEVQVWTRIKEARSRRCTFEYRVVRRDDGELLADGITVHVAIRRGNGRPARIPDRFLSRYRAAADQAEDR
jgi:acyl-CoA thioester hydrolase